MSQFKKYHKSETQDTDSTIPHSKWISGFTLCVLHYVIIKNQLLLDSSQALSNLRSVTFKNSEVSECWFSVHILEIILPLAHDWVGNLPALSLSSLLNSVVFLKNLNFMLISFRCFDSGELKKFLFPHFIMRTFQLKFNSVFHHSQGKY